MTTPTAVTSSQIDVAGKKTQLTRGGKGPPLLYLHSALGETEWTRFHEKLARQFDLLVPAHPGFALSAGLDQIDDVVDVAWHYVDLIDHLQLETVPIVGFSLGAWIALQLAILRPERVSRLVLVASAGLHLEKAPVAEIFLDELDYFRQLLFDDPDSPIVDEVLPQSVEDPRIMLWLKAREATARVGWNPYLHDPRLPRHLRRVACPTRIMWGANDRLIPVAHGEFLQSHLPDAELQVFPACGHMLPFEKTDAFVAAVASFIHP